jgi:hypothetical protein
MRPWNWLAAIVLMAWIPSPALNAQQKVDETAAMAAELKLLRTQVERLSKENAELRAALAAQKAGTAGDHSAASRSQPSQAGANTPGRRILYLIDGSGSMDNQIADLKAEVLKAIAELRPDQSFAIVIDSERAPQPLRFVPATAGNKQIARELLNRITTSGDGDALAAFQQALQLNPDVIWWLTDGSLGDAMLDIENQIRKRNTRPVRINTVTAFGGGDEKSKRLLWKVAQDSGGKCINAKGEVVSLETTAGDIRQGGKPSLLRE